MKTTKTNDTTTTSERKARANEVRAEALRQYVERLRAARVELHKALVPPAVARTWKEDDDGYDFTEDEQTALDLLLWLESMLGVLSWDSGPDGDWELPERTVEELPRYLQGLREMARARRPLIDGQRVELTAHIVEQQAGRYHRAKPWEREQLMSEAAPQLAYLLRERVDPAFETISTEIARDLIRRYEPTKARRSGGKLSVSGVVCELNRLSRWPLGRELKPRGVDNAITRYRNTSPAK